MEREELEKIKKRLDQLEYELMVSYGLIRISGGFVHVDMDSFDDECVYISVKSGVQNDVEDDTVTEELTLDRERLEFIN